MWLFLNVLNVTMWLLIKFYVITCIFYTLFPVVIAGLGSGACSHAEQR